MTKWVVCLVAGLALLAFGAGVGVNDDSIGYGNPIMWALLGGGVLLTGLAAWGIVKTRRREPYLGPGYHPGQSEPRRPGQPVGQYMEGMTPLPSQPPHVPQNHPGHQQMYQPPQQDNPPQQPFGPGSQ